MTGLGFLPEVCAIPCFDGLHGQLMLSAAANALVGQSSAELARGPDRQRFLNLVRLTDRTVGDFTLARRALRSYIDHRFEGELSSLFAAVSHVESGITAFARCLVFANALMKSQSAPQVHCVELPSRSLQKRTRLIRNAIEHYDDRIAKGQVSVETMPMLHICDSEMQLLSVVITWSELDEAVRKIHALASRLIDFQGEDRFRGPALGESEILE